MLTKDGFKKGGCWKMEKGGEAKKSVSFTLVQFNEN